MAPESIAIEVGSNSIHERLWAADGILNKWPAVTVASSFELGLFPRYLIRAEPDRSELRVFGDYINWTELREKVRQPTSQLHA